MHFSLGFYGEVVQGITPGQLIYYRTENLAELERLIMFGIHALITMPGWRFT